MEFELCELAIGGFSRSLVDSRTSIADDSRLIGFPSLPGILNVTDGELASSRFELFPFEREILRGSAVFAVYSRSVTD